ncbi:MAG: M16 family metallopeptidase [Acidobacteriota bacterium]
MDRPGVTKEVLPNGLTVLVAERRAGPVVAINLWVRTGYFDEDDRQVGISHVIEHMFFKGTPDRPRPDQIAAEVKSLGGELNAGTYYDATNYYFVLPSENFRKGLEIQADALMHPQMDAEELRREIEAIIQEGRRKLDTPGAYAFEMLLREAFDVHRIRRWRIGGEEGLRALTRDDVLAYYRSHYVPQRIILAVVGDVRAAEAVEAAHLFLAGMAKREGAPLGSPPEPAQERLKFRRVTGDIRRGYTLLGYHSAPCLTDDDFALRILGHILGGGRSSRLFQAVKEGAGLVDNVGTSIEAFQDIGVFTVMAEHEPAKGLAAVEAIQVEVERLRSHPPSVAEIEKARAAIEFRYHLGRSEVLGYSSVLAFYESLGGYALAEEAVERLSKVTAEDVQRVAGRYLKLANSTLLQYLPEEEAGVEPDLAALVTRLERASAAGPPAEAGPVPRPTPPAVEAAPAGPRLVSSATIGEVRRYRLDSGPILLHERRRDLPLVSFAIGFRGGRSAEGRENCGITRLMQASIVKGTPGRDARRVAFEIEGLGSTIERFVDEDYFGFSVGILSRHARRGFQMLLDLLRRPAFRHEEIERERALLLAAQEAVKDQSLPYTFQLFRQAAFGSHPYALPSFGLQAPVRAMKREDLVRWHRLSVRPASLVVSAVGDIDAHEAVDLLGAATADWAHEALSLKDPGQLMSWGGSEVVESRRRRQTAQVIGFPTPGLLAPDRFALDLIQLITTGLGGRFFEEVRGRRGLAYAVHAFNYHRVSGGAFAIYVATSPEHESESRRVLFKEIARLRAEGPRREEMDRAIRFARGMHAIGMQANGSRAMRYLDAELRGIGVELVRDYPERIAGVGSQEVHDAVWRYLDPDRCALGILRGDEPVP